MEGSLVNVLTWQKPIKSTLALLALNFTFWLLAGQRPIFITSVCLLFVVLRAAWKRVRGVVLVDPPDHESWTTLETYHMKHKTIDFSKVFLAQYLMLRGKSHFAFSMLTCLFFLGIGKLGTYIYLRTLLFLLANAAFLIGPLMKLIYTPKESSGELVPDIGGGGEHELWSPTDLGPDSLTPFVPPRIPDHDEDSGDDDFHFDTKHFDSSSASSTSSTSTFELINL